ncbi:MAG: O-antigen ligase family protein [Acidobacteria bacterium]|nr:O-antigen ligase family protein [Acidobacteriota bacterium]
MIGLKNSESSISGISIASWGIGFFLLFGISCTVAIIAGSAKTVFLLSLPFLILLTRALSEDSKVRLLAFTIPLSIVQIPRLPFPYQTSVSEAILLGLLLDDILFSNDDSRSSLKTPKPAAIVALGLFCFGGLIANLSGGDLSAWNIYCLTPLMVFYLISRKLHNPEDAWLFVRYTLLTIFGFLAIIKFASWAGHYWEYDPLGTEADLSSNYRMADGMMIKLGPIRHAIFATRLGAIAALGLPACVLFFIRKKGQFWPKAGLGLMIVALGYVIILSATRGSFVAAIFGSLLLILASRRFRFRTVALSLFLTVLFGEALLQFFPGENIQRLQTLSQGIQSIPNYQQRMEVLDLAWDVTLKHPLGVGFGYLFHNFEIDDAIIYAIILQGTGILGAIAFALFVVFLTLQFGQAVFKSHGQSARDLASLGLSTLAVALLAGVSSQSILFEPVHAFVFWMLMAVCYCTVASRPASSEA